ncbi:hypothetical protein BWR59_21050 [Pseudomonas sp. Bc-h]|jgi:hypothetical protein|uniref:hypothetical protein n=1 Tax=Pseudomonas sp. Bc-h TaxID=1943632 RepID=UPI0009DA0532|nr:hypothetical protein [Pseudomonas sp. Bc-h]OQR28789.1 hypothetical protein BWR59_21050 [Pseudomonas sp. Bc-h]
MNHAEVKQHVIDTLGKILVDKSLIQEEDDALLTELVLDEDDFEEFFSTLQTDFNIELPQRIKSDISRLPDHATYNQLTLQGLVDLIFTHMKGKKNH